MNSNTETTNCFCFRVHVKTGTLILGVIHMFLNTFLLSVMVVICFKASHADNSTVATNTTKYDSFIYGDSWLALTSKRTYSREDKFVGILVALLSFAASIFLVLGVTKGRATFMVPFFSLQLLDFCLACFATLGYLAYLPDVKQWISSQNIPYRRELLSLRNDWLLIIFLALVIVVLIIKAYLLQMVWKCIKFVSISTQSSDSFGRPTERLESADAAAAVSAAVTASLLPPPKYEDAVHMPVPSPHYSTAPPKYQDVV